MVFGGLLAILALVLALPFFIKAVEQNLEVFLFIMGISAAIISHKMGLELIFKGLKEPIMITAAVLMAGLLFHYFQAKIKLGISKILSVMSVKTFVFLEVVILGLLSSVITAIIAALVLVEIVNSTDISRQQKIN